MTDKNWIQTYTGKRFDFMNPQPDQICIEDIAHALSNICRYGGHSKQFYSVAEHSVHVSDYCSTHLKLWGLLDDAAEAYIGDMVRPIKNLLYIYKAIEMSIMGAIIGKFGLSPDTRPEEVTLIDNRIIMDERAQLMADSPFRWIEEEYEPLGINIECWSSTVAERIFLDMFYLKV